MVVLRPLQLAVALLVASSISPSQSRSADAQCENFNYHLEPSQVVPPPIANASGYSELYICHDDTLRGLIDIQVAETVTAVHIHGSASAGSNGSLLYQLPLPVEKRVIVGLELSENERAWLSAEELYVDVHTTLHLDGVLRGQISTFLALKETPWTVVKQVFR